MKILDHPQGTPEWLEARRGVVTASEFAAFMVESKTKAAKESRLKFICQKLMETMPNDDEEQEAEEKKAKFLDNDPWIRRGRRLEPIARDILSQKLGMDIQQTGLVLHDCGLLGASPDGLIGTEGAWLAGVEIKCHNRARHGLDILRGGLPDDHRFQVHGSMAVTGIRTWHYFGFHPMLPSHHVVVEWDPFTQQMHDGLLELVAEMNVIRAKLADLWEAEMHQRAA